MFRKRLTFINKTFTQSFLGSHTTLYRYFNNNWWQEKVNSIVLLKVSFEIFLLFLICEMKIQVFTKSPSFIFIVKVSKKIKKLSPSDFFYLVFIQTLIISYSSFHLIFCINSMEYYSMCSFFSTSKSLNLFW